MSTGYTHKILNGEIESFEDFAKLCMRQFGATFHMRDESLSKEYRPQVPSNYYKEKLQEAREAMVELETKSDEDLIEEAKTTLLGAIEDYKKTIVEKNENLEKLNNMLRQVIYYTPPTDDHDNFADFMREQLESTIEHECDASYHEERIKSCELELENLDASVLYFSKKKSIQKNIDYYLEHHEEEIKRCAKNNAWVDQVLKSLEGGK